MGPDVWPRLMEMPTTHRSPRHTASRTIVELCVDDLDGALIAEDGGADRIELCANLLEGGTTPSMGTVLSVLRAVSHVGVQIIIRPRGGNFVYSENEVEVMCRDLEAVARIAAEALIPVGVVLGALTLTGEVDIRVMRRLIHAADTLPVTFHKAFDLTPDLYLAYRVLSELGVERVLTSGGPHPAIEGVDVLAELVRRSRSTPHAPSILVGGSVRPANVNAILTATNATEIHLRAQTPSSRGDGTLHTDPAVVRELFAAMNAGHDAGTGDDNHPRSMTVIAIDVGGTTLKGALVHASGHTIVSCSIDAGRTGQESINRILELAHALRDHAGTNGHTLVGVGIVTPGMIDAENGIVHFASSLNWTDVPLRDIVVTELGVPVHVDHDVRSSGLAEALFGASRGQKDSVLVAIGTGVAASILSGGHHVVGAITTAGELGHIPVIPDGEKCTCGQHGCLEVYLSGAGLARRYAAYGGEPGLDAAAIFSRLHMDPVASRVCADGIRALALGLKVLTLLIDPSIVVLTGGVSRAGAALVDPLRIELTDSLAWRDSPVIRLSELGTSGSRIGASVLAFRASGHGEVLDTWTTTGVMAEAPTLATTSMRQHPTAE
jgi:glucokinase